MKISTIIKIQITLKQNPNRENRSRHSPGVCWAITFGVTCPWTVLPCELFATATRECKFSGILVWPNIFEFEATAVGVAAATFNRPIVTLGCVVIIRACVEPKTVGWDAETVEILEPVVKTVAWAGTSRVGACVTLAGTAKRAVVTWFWKFSDM